MRGGDIREGSSLSGQPRIAAIVAILMWHFHRISFAPRISSSIGVFGTDSGALLKTALGMNSWCNFHVKKFTYRYIMGQSRSHLDRPRLAGRVTMMCNPGTRRLGRVCRLLG